MRDRILLPAAWLVTLQIPELRAIWYAAASVMAIASERNYATFSGNVTRECMDGGAWYALACGPRGSEGLGYEEWLGKGYAAGYAPHDARLFEAYAAEFEQRAEAMGGPANPAAQEAFRAAQFWFRRDEGLDVDVQGARFVWQTCRIMRTSGIGAGFDVGPSFAVNPAGSIARIAGSFLYEACKRYKHEVAGDVGRFFHNAAHEVEACLESPVQCKKQYESCIGRCAGSGNARILQDVHTLISKAELSELALGDRFAAANANCTPKTFVFDVPLFEGERAARTAAHLPC